MKVRALLFLLVLGLSLGLEAGSFKPRGIRGNNPGNIRAANERSWMRWRGATGMDEQGYLTFRRPSDGIRALGTNLRAYYKKHKLKTVNGIIRRWVKDVDEPGKQAYIKAVCGWLKVRPHTKLNLEDPAVLQRLVRAIVRFENGQDPYSEELYKKALHKP